MTRLLAVLISVLSACASRTPAAQRPSPQPADPVPTLKFPGGTQGPQVGQIERIYHIAPSASAPSLGAPDAKVKLEVCSDFQCPYCARLAPTLHELHENYGELLQILWRNCPLPFHEQAEPAAEAALEVYAQRGSAGFWAYHDALFAHQRELDTELFVAMAREIEGVDPERVRAAVADRRHASQVRAELIALLDSGAASGGLGTPVTFVNGRMIAGAQPYREFEDAVERALQELPEQRTRAEADSLAAYPMARVRHILVQYSGARGADAHVKRDKGEAKERAEALKRRLAAERIAFGDLAREASDCPSAKEGGTLGRFTRGELEPDLDVALFVLQPGQVSEVIETPFGFHLLLREE